jgi:hypothetical protein
MCNSKNHLSPLKGFIMPSLYETAILFNWRFENNDRVYISDAINAYFEIYFMKHQKSFDFDRHKRDLFESNNTESWMDLYDANFLKRFISGKSEEDQKKYFMKKDFMKRKLFSNVYKILKKHGYSTNSNEQTDKFEIENIWVFDPSKAELINPHKDRDFYIRRCETFIKNIKENFVSCNFYLSEKEIFLLDDHILSKSSKFKLEFEYDKENACKSMPLNIFFISEKDNFRWKETVLIGKKSIKMEKAPNKDNEKYKIFQDDLTGYNGYFDFLSMKVSEIYSAFMSNKQKTLTP